VGRIRKKKRREKKRREKKRREKKRIEEKRRKTIREDQRRERVRRKSQKKEVAGARKSRKVAKHSVFATICGSGGSKSWLAKAAGAEPSGGMRDEKLHAVVARSTLGSE
jgi:glutamate synthase domain-containing protein 3